MKLLGFSPRFILLAAAAMLLLTACPALSILPRGRVKLVHQVGADYAPGLRSNAYFATNDYLIYYWDNAVTAFDPASGSTAWQNTYPMLLTAEYDAENDKMYVWPFGHNVEETPDPLTVVVVDAATGEAVKEFALNAPTEIVERWNPEAIARIGSVIYVDETEGEIAVLRENASSIDYQNTIRIEDVYFASQHSEWPDYFRALKMLPAADRSGLYVLVTTSDGFFGLDHLYRINADGTKIWSAAPRVQPEDFLLVDDRVVYLTSVGAVFLDAGSGEEIERTDIPIGDCPSDEYDLHPAKYDSENGLIYAPIGTLDVSGNRAKWLWEMPTLIDRVNITECNFKPAVKDGIAYFGAGNLLAVDVTSGKVVDIEGGSRTSYELRINSPAFSIGPYILTLWNDYTGRTYINVYQPNF